MNKDIANTQTSDLVMSVDSMPKIIQFAEFMAGGTVMIPDHFKNKPSDCAAIVMQSIQWGMNPFAVAQKTHLVSGTLGYEAQLVNAVISSSNAITGRFHYEYSEGWEALAGKVAMKKVKKNGKNGAYEVEQAVAEWKHEEELPLWVRIGATLRGENDIQWGEKLFLASVLVRNSPLWVTNPKQQIGYLAVKYWSRQYTPALILGVYTTDELQDIPREEKDVTASAMVKPTETSEPATQEQAEPEAEDAEIIEQPAVKLTPMMEILDMIATTDKLDEMEEIKDNAIAFYAKDSEERIEMVAIWKEKKAIILRAADAEKLANK